MLFSFLKRINAVFGTRRRTSQHPYPDNASGGHRFRSSESRRPSRAPCLPCLQLLPWNFAINALLTAHPRMAAVFLRTCRPYHRLEQMQAAQQPSKIRRGSLGLNSRVGASDFEVLPTWCRASVPSARLAQTLRGDSSLRLPLPISECQADSG